MSNYDYLKFANSINNYDSTSNENLHDKQDQSQSVESMRSLDETEYCAIWGRYEQFVLRAPDSTLPRVQPRDEGTTTHLGANRNQIYEKIKLWKAL